MYGKLEGGQVIGLEVYSHSLYSSMYRRDMIWHTRPFFFSSHLLYGSFMKDNAIVSMPFLMPLTFLPPKNITSCLYLPATWARLSCQAFRQCRAFVLLGFQYGIRCNIWVTNNILPSCMRLLACKLARRLRSPHIAPPFSCNPFSYFC